MQITVSGKFVYVISNEIPYTMTDGWFGETQGFVFDFIGFHD